MSSRHLPLWLATNASSRDGVTSSMGTNLDLPVPHAPCQAGPMDNTAALPVDRALLDAAVGLAQRAGELTLRYFKDSGLVIDTKADGTPVTAADRGAERLLREQIGELFPEDGILGEEEAETVGTSGRRWIIDPIDGTKAFTHGVPLYTNLVALEDAEGIAVGIINIPALGETVYAGRGLGAYMNGEPIHVNDRSTVADSYVMTSGITRWDGSMVDKLRGADMHLRTWADGYGYAMVATGRAEAMIDFEAELYDLAPAPVILAEAGGRFTDLSGGLTPGGGSGLATNGHLHDFMLETFGSL